MTQDEAYKAAQEYLPESPVLAERLALSLRLYTTGFETLEAALERLYVIPAALDGLGETVTMDDIAEYIVSFPRRYPVRIETPDGHTRAVVSRHSEDLGGKPEDDIIFDQTVTRLTAKGETATTMGGRIPHRPLTQRQYALQIERHFPVGPDTATRIVLEAQRRHEHPAIIYKELVQ